MTRAQLAGARLAFVAATAIFALPVYAKTYSIMDWAIFAKALILVHVLPFLLLGILLRLTRRPRARTVIELSLCFLILVSVLRLAQAELLAQSGSQLLRTTIGLISVVGGVFAVFFWRKTIAIGISTTAPAVLVGLVLYFAGPLVASEAARQPAAPDRTDSVFVLIFDGLGRDVLTDGKAVDALRFPSIAALARTSAWFTNGTANYADTCREIPMMVSGQLARNGSCQDFYLSDDSNTLLTSLAQHYRVRVYEEYLRDCRPRANYVCKGTAFFAMDQPQTLIGRHWIPAGLRLGASRELLGSTFSPFSLSMFNEFLRDIDVTVSRGSAYFLHLQLPHPPYVLDSAGEIRDAGPTDFQTSPEDEKFTWERYVEQTQFVDSLVGRLSQKLADTHLLETSYIFLTGDTGPRPLVTSAPLSPALVNVPLLVRTPAGLPLTVDIDYQHLDFSPTVLDVLEIEPVAPLDGLSGFRERSEARPRLFSWGSRTFRYDESSAQWLEN